MNTDWDILQGDCLELMAEMGDSSVDAIVTDPPYFKVKGDWWDHQWDDRDKFIAWIGQLCEQWQRILKPNGSLYCFASPQMRARVEVEVGRWFNCLPTITWVKPCPTSDINWGASNSGRICKEAMRSYYPNTEAIIFAEHFSADNMAKGEAGYVAKCDELRGFVFEPLRAYLDGERSRAGVSVRQVAEAFQEKTGSRTVTGMAGHWFGMVQWSLPTEDNYDWLRGCLACMNHHSEYLRKDYEYLRKDYEDLRTQFDELKTEYEDLRRPFNVTPDVPYTDVWDFKTVQDYPGKHPCEKPIAMMEHIIDASTRPGDLVLDCFAGSGVTGEACRHAGRNFIGLDIETRWCNVARAKLSQGLLV